MELQAREQPAAEQLAVHHHAAPRPQLPKFDEKMDDIDAYLERFERYANSQHWEEDTWAVSLSPLLTGKALEVYSALPIVEANIYQGLKTAILRRYQLTTEGFRQKFRNAVPEREEGAKQFGARIKRYLDRWIDLSEIERNFAELYDLILREQFISKCSNDLTMFLKERTPETFTDVNRISEQYLEAHGGSIGQSKPKVVSKFPPPRPTFSPRPAESVPSSVRPTCFYCNREGHLKRDCLKLKAARGPSHGPTRENASQNWRRRSPDDRKMASCAIITASENIQDGNSASDEEIPLHFATALIDRSDTLQVYKGFVGSTPVRVLRDSGCTGAIVREDLVKEEQLTGKYSYGVAYDSTVKKHPLAVISVDTPLITGEIEVLVVQNPVVDLIIGNISGLREEDEKMEAERTDVTGAERDISAAVETREEQRREKRPIQPLITPDFKVDEINSEQLQKLQKEDETLDKLFEHAKEKTVLSTRNNGNLRYVIRGGILTRYYLGNKNGVDEKIKQIVVPKSLRKRIMSLAHESIVGGHLGTKKTSDRIVSNFHWPGIDGDIRRFCQSCDICQRTMPKGRVGKVPLGEMPIMDTPFDRVAVDIIGPIYPVSDNRNRYILTIVDYATRYPEAVPLKSIETERVAEALLEVFSRVGFPKEILSDQGAQFTSGLMAEVARLVSMKQLFTTPYNPKCNGLCERINGVLKMMLKKMCQERPKDWDRYLPAVLFAYREVPQASTGFSPFELLYGRKVRGPMDILLEIWSGNTMSEDVRNTYQYVVDLRNKLEDTCRIARNNLIEAQGKYRHHYDKKTRSRVFKVGQSVYLLLPTDHNKLLLQWKGPFKVTRVLNRMDYEIEINGKKKIYHANLLKECVKREEGIDADDNDDGSEEENESVSGDSDRESVVGNEVAAFAKIAVISESDYDDHYDEARLSFPETLQKETIADVQINSQLSVKQQKELYKLLEEFKDIFSDVPGKTTLGEHKIELTTKEPIRVRPYPMPFAKRQAVQEEVDKMLEAGIIEPSRSEYNSPIVLVKKKDGSNRFCIDFRRLNSVTKFDTEPMENYEDIIARTGGDKVFSKLDFSKGYWQIPMEEGSKCFTTFATPNGSYQFCRNPFGLVNSGSAFNRVIRKLLANMCHIDAYVDDVLPHTVEWQTHMEVLRELFIRIRKAKLTLRPTKCLLGYESVPFTGHIIGQGKLQMEEDKIEKIKSAKRPGTKKQVRSFLGLAGFYRKFIPGFARLAAPLTDLTKKGKSNYVKWTSVEEEAFESLKASITCAPILRLPDFKKQFVLRSDASNTGLGAILLQKHDDGVFPIAFASRKLLTREQNYSVTEKECLAIVFGITKFQKYLYGVEFVIETDHAPLAYLRKAKNESQRLMRWALFLQSYSFTVNAIKGSDNIGADYLSRLE